jgi:hypothetical protein
MSDDKEQRILSMFDKSSPKEEDLFETSYVNHIAWSIAVVALGLVVWLAIALVRAENHRFALESGMCQDPLFKGKVDEVCMKTVRSRDHWWEHLWFGIRHVR